MGFLPPNDVGGSHSSSGRETEGNDVRDTICLSKCLLILVFTVLQDNDSLAAIYFIATWV